MDDIRDETPISETTKVPSSGPGGQGPRTIGPESETRGGPEAPATTLGEEERQPASPQESAFIPPDGMPGMRAGLPAGSLPGPYLGPQGDEDRTPPGNAPSPVTPAVTVADPAGATHPA
jgi:hypothetical protein